MERRLNGAQSGYALITVLIVTAIGLLFGVGALLLFKFQCQRRIDRQHELEKIYAVRSAANYAKVGFIAKAREFKYQTSSGRELSLTVEPAKRIFPSPGNPVHLDIGNDCGKGRVFGSAVPEQQYASELDYEYGAMSNNDVLAVTDQQICAKDGKRELVFPDCTATNGVKWWVNIGLNEVRGWLQEDYGIRYSFTPVNYGPGRKDILRLCVIRNTNHVERVGDEWVGCKRGWPLSPGERALVLEVAGTGDMTLYEYAYQDRKIRGHLLSQGPTYNMGIQIAGRNVYLFYTPNFAEGLGYVLSNAWEMPDERGGIFDYFSEVMQANAAGLVGEGPIRVVIECEAASDERPYTKTNDNDYTGEIRISSFRVFPAYQYDVYLKSPGLDSELATVVQKIGKYDEMYDDEDQLYNLGFSMRTYDTHGTAWKGYKRK